MLLYCKLRCEGTTVNMSFTETLLTICNDQSIHSMNVGNIHMKHNGTQQVTCFSLFYEFGNYLMQE
jgi:hypothetical protein